MSEDDLKKKLEENIDGTVASVLRKGRVSVSVPSAGALSALVFVKSLGFEHLSAVSCTDWLEANELELVYHLWSYADKVHLMLKTRIPRDNARMVTATPVFKHAQTYEREIHEMFGVYFDGNARLVPLLLDHWEGLPPMRRDFNTREYVRDVFGVEERGE